MKKCFLTGCDDSCSWMLPWFIRNFKKHNDTPIIFADFGITDRKTLRIVKKSFDGYLKLDSPEKGWFKKPSAMLQSPGEYTCWIDTDCEVRGNLDSIFDTVKISSKLSMVLDHPWTKRTSEEWYNSGVIAYHLKPKILSDWKSAILTSPIVGDQQVLHILLKDSFGSRVFIEEIDHKYNYLRLDVLDIGESSDALIMHWTGPKGKEKIMEKIRD